jgi:hypothetical protein
LKIKVRLRKKGIVRRILYTKSLGSSCRRMKNGATYRVKV